MTHQTQEHVPCLHLVGTSEERFWQYDGCGMTLRLGVLWGVIDESKGQSELSVNKEWVEDFPECYKKLGLV
jgi:hypothetical protein